MMHGPINIRCTNSCFIKSLLYACTCFEHYVLIIRRWKLYYTASCIVALCRWLSGAKFLYKTIICALSWLITKIILRCTFSKTSKIHRYWVERYLCELVWFPSRVQTLNVKWHQFENYPVVYNSGWLVVQNEIQRLTALILYDIACQYCPTATLTPTPTPKTTPTPTPQVPVFDHYCHIFVHSSRTLLAYGEVWSYSNFTHTQKKCVFMCICNLQVSLELVPAFSSGVKEKPR
jgi:hypothetical protein